MSKRSISFVMVFCMCLEIVFIAAFAKSPKAFDLYQSAMRTTVKSGSWTENLNLTANMVIARDGIKVKAKATLNSTADVSGYSEDDLSNLKISGFANIDVMEESYAWNIQYENGIAHYQYTKPNQMSTDVEMDPDFFNFSTITYNMIEDAEVSADQIAFTIPGNKMEESAVPAVKKIANIDNLHYGDVNVKVMTNKVTGQIDTILMNFHASMTYMSYDAETDYNITYRFKGNENSVTVSESDKTEESLALENGIVVYSDHTNLSVQKNSIITLGADIIVDGKETEDASGITFQVADTSTLEMSSTDIIDNVRYVNLKGLKAGTTNVTFTDSNTGYTTTVPITVYENSYTSYTLATVPQPTYVEKKYPTNFYNVNGLYIDSYAYEINDDKSAHVTFDVYNTNYSYGIVGVYNEDGSMSSAVLIDKMEVINTNLKRALVDNACYLVRDFIIKGNAFTYRQESGFSVKTPVDITIPANGYLKITTSGNSSFILGVVNSLDVLMQLSELSGDLKAYSNVSDEFSKKITKKLLVDKTYETLIKDGNDFSDSLWKNISSEIALSPKAAKNYCETLAKNIEDLKLGEIIAETSVEFGFNISEKLFKFFSGPIGQVMGGMFLAGKTENVLTQLNDMTKPLNVGSICIQNQGGGIRSVQQVKVESKNDLPAETALNAFKVTLDPEILKAIKEMNPEIYEHMVNGHTYTYNISLSENGVETQPDSEVMVYIPIPKNMKVSARMKKVKIYRVGENGALSEMNVGIKDNCFVFKTGHFSLYTLVGENVLPILCIGGILVIAILSAIAILLFVQIKKNKKKRLLPENADAVN